LRDVCEIGRDKEETEKRKKEGRKYGGSNFAKRKLTGVDLAI